MRIQFLNGGLANQVFQYIFVRFAEKQNPKEAWFLDDSFFYTNQIHNGYELEKVFGIRANLLSGFFEPDVWEELIRLKKEGVSLPQSFMDMGIPMVMLAESKTYQEFNPFTGEIVHLPANSFLPEIVNVSAENVYYHGYWINKKWLESCGKDILSEFQFPKIADEKNAYYESCIVNAFSVGIHIRRGDFVTLGWDMPDEYYRSSCEEVARKHKEAVFFVFSDDIEWCKENEERLGLKAGKGLIYVEGNVEGNNYIDMQLLALCRGLVMSKSSFCYLAALLNKNLQFVVNPTNREV